VCGVCVFLCVVYLCDLRVYGVCVACAFVLCLFGVRSVCVRYVLKCEEWLTSEHGIFAPRSVKSRFCGAFIKEKS